MDLLGDLDGVLDALEAAGVDYALCGGLAVALHGHVRATRDIDVMVRREDFGAARAALRGRGFTLDAGPIPFGAGTEREREVRRVSKIVDGALTTVDFLVVTPVLERAWQTRAAYPWRGRHVTAVSIEGLTEMKRMAGRKQDLADLEHLGVPEEDA
jgi:hypothetical protein